MIDSLLGDAPAEDWRLYLPVLRAKASEWAALAELTPGVRRRIAPILEFVPDWKQPGASTSSRKRRAPQTHREYLDRFVDACIGASSSGTRSFVYFGLAGPDGQWHGIDLWFAFKARVPPETRVIPLVDLSAVRVPTTLARLARSRELGLRVQSADIGPALATHIATALRALSIASPSVHLVVDLRDNPAARSHSQIRAAMGNAGAFASVVVLAGVFPRDLSGYQLGISEEPRSEWQTWWHEHAATPADEAFVGYGDYATQCAHYHVLPEKARGSVSLRYTTDDVYLVLRGSKSSSASGLGHDQMHGHCRMLIRRPEYAGAAFSEGDHWISCWTNPPKPGNFALWRTASLIHHITQVVVQLQDAAGSSATARAWLRAQAPAPCP